MLSESTFGNTNIHHRLLAQRRYNLSELLLFTGPVAGSGRVWKWRKTRKNEKEGREGRGGKDEVGNTMEQTDNVLEERGRAC